MTYTVASHKEAYEIGFTAGELSCLSSLFTVSGPDLETAKLQTLRLLHAAHSTPLHHSDDVFILACSLLFYTI